MTVEMIDRAVFDELSDAMGSEFVVELVTTFLGDAPNLFADLTAAVSAGEADAYRRAAHSVKSNAEVFGATALADQAREMELGGLAADQSHVEALQATYTQTAAALKGFLDD